MRNRLARVLGVAGEAEGLRAVERDGVAHFARGVRVGAVQRCLLRCLRLGILRGCYKCVLGQSRKRQMMYTPFVACLPLVLFVGAIAT